MKKLFLAVMAAFTLLPFAQAADDHMETTRVVFFPYREAILSSRIDGIVLENKLIKKYKKILQMIVMMIQNT